MCILDNEKILKQNNIISFHENLLFFNNFSKKILKSDERLQRIAKYQSYISKQLQHRTIGYFIIINTELLFIN